jgi:hypothetical protein
MSRAPSDCARSGCLGVDAEKADTFQTYDLAWSGATFGNDATATGQITLDLTTLPNPAAQGYDLSNDTASLTVTVVGASSGNGTWTKADLGFTF